MTSETFSVDDGCVIAENVIKRASQLGAYAAETGISSGNGMTVTVRNGELETLEHHRDKSMVVSAVSYTHLTLPTIPQV